MGALRPSQWQFLCYFASPSTPSRGLGNEMPFWVGRPRSRVWVTEDYFIQNVPFGVITLLASCFGGVWTVLFSVPFFMVLFLSPLLLPLTVLPVWALLWPIRTHLCRPFLRYYLSASRAVAEYKVGFLRLCWSVSKRDIGDFEVRCSGSFLCLRLADLKVGSSTTDGSPHFSFMFDGLTLAEVRQVVADFGYTNRVVNVWSDVTHEAMEWGKFWRTGGPATHWKSTE